MSIFETVCELFTSTTEVSPQERIREIFQDISIY